MESTSKLRLYGDEGAIGLLKGYLADSGAFELKAIAPAADRELPGCGEFILIELSETRALVGCVIGQEVAGQLASEQGEA